MKHKLLTLLILTIASMYGIQAQELTGLWEVKNVEVSGKTMTPVARWTQINADHTFASGNGWLQHTVGSWTYDHDGRKFLTVNENGIKDEYGAFKVIFKDNKMVWQRQEEGVAVQIELNKVEKLPMTPADQLTGLWNLTEVLKNNEPLQDKESHYIFFRWDRIYVQKGRAGSHKSGYWHIQAHQPQLTMIDHDDHHGPERWDISVSDDKLVMMGISEKNKGLKLIYQRIDVFPY